jgi:hypothetical protein
VKRTISRLVDICCQGCSLSFETQTKWLKTNHPCYYRRRARQILCPTFGPLSLHEPRTQSTPSQREPQAEHCSTMARNSSDMQTTHGVNTRCHAAANVPSSNASHRSTISQLPSTTSQAREKARNTAFPRPRQDPISPASPIMLRHATLLNSRERKERKYRSRTKKIPAFLWAKSATYFPRAVDGSWGFHII